MAMKQILLFLFINLPFFAYSQFFESFDNGSWLEGWSGDTERFAVEEGVLMLDGLEEKEELQLSHAYAMPSGDVSWEFYLYLKTTPTDGNHVVVYPTSSKADSPDGFYLRVGHNRSKRISYGFGKKQSDRFDVDFDLESSVLHIKIILQENRKWTILARNAYESPSLRKIAEFEYENPLPQSAYFYVRFVHTKSNPKVFGIDDIQIKENTTEVPEEPEKPEYSTTVCESILPLSESEIRYEFSGPVRINGDNTRFSISGKGFNGKTDAIKQVQNSNDSVVNVRFPNEMTVGEEYTFYWKGVIDEEGLPIKDGSVKGTLVTSEEDPDDPEQSEEPELPTESFTQGDIRINEVMADPNGFIPKTEYIELYNTLDRSIRLKNWVLLYGEKTKVALDEVLIAARGYVVLYRTDDEEFDLASDLVCPLDKFPANLRNDGSTLSLLYFDQEIDRCSYPKAEAGKSWEYAPDGWHLSTDEKGGTPGVGNSDSKVVEPDEPEPSESFLYGDILINEVMADPKGFEPETEYIELYNTLDKSVDLNGWILEYDGRRDMFLDGIVLPASGYVALYDEEKDALSERNAYPVNDLYPLANGGGKSLVLYDSSGEVIDECTYPKAHSGKSWERGVVNWHLSSDPRGGTPSTKNSDGQKEEEEDTEDDEEEDEEEIPETSDMPQPEKGDIIINELLPEPFVGGSEYIELLNRSSRDLSLSDLCISVRKKDGSLNTHYPLSGYTSLLPSGAYLLISKSIADVEAFYLLPADVNCLECKLPVLSNTGASVVLYRETDGVIIDEVSYSPKWHAPSVKDKKGVALERINPNGDSQDAANWTSAASSAGSGTPGGRNSQYLSGNSVDETVGTESISIPTYQPSGVYHISYHLDQAGYSARGVIFDIGGREVAVFIENESLGTDGVIEWSGSDRDGNRLSAGIYIMYMDLWHANGSKLNRKAAFLYR